MRKFLILFLFIALLAGPAFAEEEKEASPPFLTVNMVLKDAIAFTGLGLELLLGNIGIGGTFTLFFIGDADGNSFYIYEPGAYVHLYLGKPEGSLYVLGDISFAMIGISDSSGESIDTGDYNSGILALNVGLGFNAFFGDDKNIHFAIEAGARYNTLIIQGEETAFGLWSPVIPHLQILFGLGVI